MNDPTASGWKSSEGLFSLLHMVLSFATAAGLLTVVDGMRLETALASGVTAAFALASSAVVVWAYVRSRTAVKTAAVAAAAVTTAAAITAAGATPSAPPPLQNLPPG